MATKTNKTRMTREDRLMAAKKAETKLGLKEMPLVFESEALAFSMAGKTKCDAVMLGEGAYWVVCMRDAARLEKAGYEFAPLR